MIPEIRMNIRIAILIFLLLRKITDIPTLTRLLDLSNWNSRDRAFSPDEFASFPVLPKIVSPTVFERKADGFKVSRTRRFYAFFSTRHGYLGRKELWIS